MICLRCSELRFGFPGRLCYVCSELLVPETAANRAALFSGRLENDIARWLKKGAINSETAAEVRAAIAADRAVSAEQESARTADAGGDESFLANLTEPLRDRAARLTHDLSALFAWPSSAASSQKEHRGRPAGKGDLKTAAHTARAMTGEGGHWDGLDEVAQLDGFGAGQSAAATPDEGGLGFWTALQPLFNTYVWWFIGTLLVLTGSILGIREAWLVLSGVARQLTVLAALFVYHALFGALGLALTRRSRLTGALLSTIGLLLLAVPYAAAADVYALDAPLGLASLAILVLLSVASIALASRPFRVGGRTLVLSLLPVYLLQSLIPLVRQQGSAPALVPLLVLAALVPAVFLAVSISRQADAGNQPALLFSLYASLGALAVYVLPLSGLLVPFRAGSVEFGVVLLWSWAFAALLSTAAGVFRNQKRSLVRIILGVGFLSVVLVTALIGAAGLFSAPAGMVSVTGWGSALELLVPALSAVVLFFAARAHPPAAPVALFLSALSGLLLAREWSGEQSWWAIGAANVPLTLLLFHRALPVRFAATAKTAGVGAGALLCVFLIYRFFLPQGAALGAPAPIWFGGLIFALTAHLGVGRQRSWVHHAGALGLFTLMLALVPFLETVDWATRFATLFGLTSLFYAVAAVVFESLAGGRDSDRLRPFDDMAFGLGLAGGLCALFGATESAGTAVSSLQSLPSVSPVMLPMALGLLLFWLSFREESTLISFAAVALLGSAAARFLGGPSFSSGAFGAATAGAGAAVLASLFPKLKPTDVEVRRSFFVLRLPFPARGPALVRDALAGTALVFGALASLKLVLWLGQINEPERSASIMAGLLVCSVLLLGLFGGGFRAFRMRGELHTLVAIGVCAALTAVVNRMGRPLPPSVVGLNLSLGVVALFVLSKALERWGPSLGDRLEAPAAGKHYHTVTLFGMLTLGSVLLLDVWLIGPANPDRALFVVPPTFFVGAGLSALLFGRSLGLSPFVHLGLGFFLCASGLGFAQHSLLGTELVQLNAPTGMWVPKLVAEAGVSGGWEGLTFSVPQQFLGGVLVRRFGQGLAAAGTLFAFCSMLFGAGRFGSLRRVCFGSLESRDWSEGLALWSLGGTFVLALIGYRYAFVAASGVALLGGALLLFSGQVRVGAPAVALQGLLLVQGLAHLLPQAAPWAGPALALCGAGLVLVSRTLSRLARLPYGRTLEAAHLGAALYGVAGIIYALGAAGPLDAQNALPGVLAAALQGVSANAWLLSPALGLTLALLSLGLLIASVQWTQIPSTALATAGPFVLGLAAAALFPYAWGLTSWDIPSVGVNVGVSLSPWFPFFAACVAAVAVVAQVLGEFGRARADWARGIGQGREALIVFAGALFALDQRLGGSTSGPGRAAGTIAIVLVIAVSSWAAWRNLQPRHIYFVQVGIACLYAALRPLFGSALPAEFDALAALLFGFALVGVTVAARRAGIPPLAESTRRFAAALPLVAFLILPRAPTLENAGMAALAGALYSALAAASGSRLLALCAALAANVALLTVALASRIQGIEVYLAPLGLMTLLLGHIFRKGLPQRARDGVRVVGGLLLYVPSAVKITLEIGRGADTTYALVFAGVCLVAVVAGMLLQIRAYLFMGTLFLTLDVLANLVQTGLRDRRLAFVLLSTTGLLIIGGLVFVTLRREQLSGALRGVSRRLRDWE